MSRKTYVDTNISLENIDPILKDFLDAQKPKTRKTYGCLMRKLIEFTKHQTGTQLLAEQEAWSRKIMIFLQWLKNQGYSDAYATTACGMLRSFFDFYHKPLDLNRQERTKLKERMRNSEDYLFLKEDIAKMATIGSLKEKYVVLAGASFGLRSEDFAEITYGKMRIALEKAEKQNTEAPIPLDPVCTQKEKGVKAFPFVSSDALPIIKAMLDGNKEAKDSDRIWNERPSQLTVVLQNLVKKGGIDPHGSRIRFHNLRKYLSDRLSSTMSESKWKQIVGKKISEGAYVSSDELREGYLRAMPLIVINANGNGEIRRKVETQTEEIQDLKLKSLTLYEKIEDLTLESQKRARTELDNVALINLLNGWVAKQGSPEDKRTLAEIKKRHLVP